MQKIYSIDTGNRWDDYSRIEGLQRVREIVYDSERYRTENSDYLIESLDENNNRFEFGSCSWSCSEVLDALSPDTLSEYLDEESQYQCDNELPYQYDQDLEDLEIGDTLEISETGCKVTLIELIPETAAEAEEIGWEDVQNEAAALL